jgi:hypothetical protein
MPGQCFHLLFLAPAAATSLRTRPNKLILGNSESGAGRSGQDTLNNTVPLSLISTQFSPAGTDAPETPYAGENGVDRSEDANGSLLAGARRPGRAQPATRVEEEHRQRHYGEESEGGVGLSFDESAVPVPADGTEEHWAKNEERKLKTSDASP